MHGAVVLRGVACRYNDPAVGHAMTAEDLVLQELQHGRGQRLGNAVDFVKEENAFLLAGCFHGFVYRRDDFAHGIFGNVVLFAAIGPVRNERQSEGALARVMRHGVGNETHFELLRDLLHDGGLADAGCADQEDGALPVDGKAILPEFVFGEIRFHGPFDLLFCLPDVHGSSRCAASFVANRASCALMPFPLSSKTRLKRWRLFI